MKRTLSLLTVLFLGTSGCSDQPLAPEIELTPDATSSTVATANGITITSIQGPTDPVAVNTPVQITADFTGASGDTHTGLIRWGDGTSTVATINEIDGAEAATANRSYVLPGVYMVEVEISNQSAESVRGTHEYVTVYDPEGGYVSGNGAILSPPNACTWSGCVADEGVARFGFSSRYHRGAAVPDGSTRFTFRDGNFTFSSTAYEWLVISGARAKYKGVGTVNREGNYGFMLTASDSDRAGGGEEDRFRIRIWDRDNGDAVVYDNQAGEGDDADLTADGTRLTRGSITIRSTTRNDAPVVIITSPADGATFLETDGVLFSADGGDAEDGDISASVSWSSDLAGELGVGAELPGVSLAPGTHTITARVTDSGGLQAIATVTVEIAEVTISVSPSTATISEGDTQQFTATVYANGVEMLSGAPTVAWSSSDVSVATIGSAGVATGVSPGEADIRAAIGSVEGGALLNVQEAIGVEIVQGTITAGTQHSCGLDTNGNAYCWGYGKLGVLGNGTSVLSAPPVAVTMPEGVTFSSISAGFEFTLALATTGEAYAWGHNNYGQLGIGYSISSVHLTPVEVEMPAGVRFSSISAGYYHAVAITSTGAAYGWGVNWYGQLGDGTMTNRDRPTAVAMPPGVSFVSISTNSFHTVALDATGAAYAWGGGGDGRLGDGTTTRRTKPVAVIMPQGATFSSISAGNDHTAAVSSTGKVYAWGSNNYDQLGIAEIDLSTTPALVDMPAGVRVASIGAGSGHTLALTSTGGAYAWGYNVYGQLGDGTTIARTTPVAVEMPSGASFVSINVGQSHSLALASTGDAYAWGYNGSGRLGTTGGYVYTPAKVIGDIIFMH